MSGESVARNPMTPAKAQAVYFERLGGLVVNKAKLKA